MTMQSSALRTGTSARRLFAALLATTALLSLSPQAGAVRPPVMVSGADPFAACTADSVATQPGSNYPGSEIEPWIESNPQRPDNLIAGWQQDRWSDGGARGLVAGVSIDGGRTWARLVPPGVSKCSGGVYDRATDPWVAISPNGTAYFMSLAFDNNRPDGGGGANAMLVSRSLNGGMSWSAPIPLIVDTDGQIFNDKNSMTADPADSNYVYAVWDRFFDYSLPAGRVASASQLVPGEGVAQVRQRRQWLADRAAGKATSRAPSFKAPAVFTRTSNGGQSWEPPRTIYDPGNDAQTLGNVIAVLPDGALLNLFFNFAASGDVSIGVQKSLNKGKTFSAPSFPIAANVTLHGTRSPDSRKAVRDGNSLLDVAVDRDTGAVYVVWQDGRLGGMDKVFFSQSLDGGATWSDPAYVAMTPDSPVRLRNQSTTPSVEVGPDHQVTVTYYDFRNDLSDGRELMDYFAVFCTPSAAATCAERGKWGDGVTAGADIRLTRTSFDILKAPFAGGYFLGDYMGLTRRKSVLMPAFGMTDGENQTSIYTTPIIRANTP